MNYQQRLLETTRQIIVCDVWYDRAVLKDILVNLELACIEACEQEDFHFFTDLREVLALPSKGWGWVKVSGFRAKANKVVRRHGMGMALVACLQICAMLDARQSANTQIVEAPQVANEH